MMMINGVMLRFHYWLMMMINDEPPGFTERTTTSYASVREFRSSGQRNHKVQRSWYGRMRSRQMSGCTLGLALLLSPGAGTSLFVTRPALHSHGYGVTARVSSRALCLCVPGALAPPLPLRLRLPLSFITGAMARRTVQDMLMQGARAQARGSRLPASQKGKAAATVEMEVDDKASSSKSEELKKAKAQQEVPSVDDAINALLKKHLDFDPKAAAFWKAGDRVPFLFLARAFDLISNESGRLAMTEILSNVFRTVIATSPNDLLSVVYLSANRIAPAHEGVELGIGDASIIKVLAETFGKKDEHIKTQLKSLGDLGLVAKANRSAQRLMSKPLSLTCVKVLDVFRVIAKESGKDSQDKKRAKMKSLIVAATDCEPLYVVRLLQGKTRIGLAEQTVLAALAQAAVFAEQPPVAAGQIASRIEEAVKIMKQTYSILPNYDKIVPALLDVGISNLRGTCRFTLGVPVGPMLAKPTKGVSEILDKFQGTQFTCEYKYDGERAQIHFLEDETVEIYSRNAERNTGKYPDIVASISRFRKPGVTSFVLDCEVVAYDREKDKILPFQVLSTRARKGVIVSDIKVQVCLFAFDLLYLNGRELLQEPLSVRREALYSSFTENTGKFQFATAIISNELDEIQVFLDDAVNHSCEGLIVKTLDKDATYEPARRSQKWLKLKKDYMDSIGDSLDLVPIGAFHGRGKRVGVYGAYLLACYDEAKEEFQSICKIATGFSDTVLEERSASLRKQVIPRPKPYFRYGETLGVDVWFEPSEVWEVKAADLSISPVHCAATGIVDPNKGISLRFPRLLKIREDKNPDQATTAEQVAEMYRSQKIHHAGNGNGNGDGDGDDEDD